jgi:hypothetical protein
VRAPGLQREGQHSSQRRDGTQRLSGRTRFWPLDSASLSPRSARFSGRLVPRLREREKVATGRVRVVKACPAGRLGIIQCDRIPPRAREIAPGAGALPNHAKTNGGPGRSKQLQSRNGGKQKAQRRIQSVRQAGSQVIKMTLRSFQSPGGYSSISITIIPDKPSSLNGRAEHDKSNWGMLSSLN